jgi:phosphatidylserine decarboxylase
MGMVAVGAFGNGHIYLHFDDGLETNRWDDYPGQRHEVTYRWPVSLEPGEEMGGFKLGSCLVLLFEAPLVNGTDRKVGEMGFIVQPGESVRTGQALVLSQ